MKKMISTLMLSLLLGLTLSTATYGFEKIKTEPLNGPKPKEATQLFSRPEGILYGPNYVASTTTELLAYSFSGDPIPVGAYYAIDDYTEYAPVGVWPGSTFGMIYIPVSAFGGPGVHYLFLLFEEDGVLMNYAYPLTVTVY